MTSAFASSCAATEERGSVYGSVYSRFVPYFIEVPLWTSSFERGEVVNFFIFEPVPFSSDFSVENVESLEVRQNQHWATRDVAIVQIPGICKTSTFLERVSWVIRAAWSSREQSESS